tara:strand:+ start:2803 stop:3672 length:870 start_codon:yes stop_codon:yes gene_type:complete
MYDRYQQALIWLESLGITVGSGRLQNYDRTIAYWKDAYATASENEGKEIFPEFMGAMFEVHDIIDIYEAFKDETPSNLAHVIEKLKLAVTGPVNLHEETTTSTKARNFLFEAVVDARMHNPQAGIRTILNATSDSGFQVGSKKVWIECKRVTRLSKIEKNVKKASSQLESLFEQSTGTGHRGIVALEVSKIFHAGDQLLVQKDDENLNRALNEKMDKFIAENARIWESIYQKRNKKIIGTLLRFSFMAVSEQRNLAVHASQWGMNPRTTVSASDQSLMKNFVSLLVRRI